ncbi:MAG: hypothetical protein ACTSXG_00925 [Alphaproteobacteria bacterium]
MKLKYVVFFVFLYVVSATISFAMELEETRENQIIQKISPIEETKNKIQQQLGDLKKVLDSEQYREISYQKGWLNKEQPNQGLLLKLSSDIDPSKKKVLDDIGTFFRQQKNYDLMNLACDPCDLIKMLPALMIESRIVKYFEGRGIGKVISIRENPNGVQFKRIATVGNPPIDYHIKTHSGGLLQETQKSTSKAVDPIELLVYKVLEYSGYLSDTHFFYDDLRNFYIATKDISAYSNSPEKEKIRSYSKFLTQDKKGFVEELTKICTEDSNPIIHGLMTADILSRVLCLTDILTQDGNILFVRMSNTWQVKIIDFRHKDPEVEYPTGGALFGGLVQGNGQCHYVGVDQIMSHYLGTPNLASRIQYAKTFDYKSLKVAVGKAEYTMLSYMTAPENVGLFGVLQDRVSNHSTALQNIISQFEEAANTYKMN